MASRRSAPSGHVATTTTTQKWGSLFTWPKGPFSACHSHRYLELARKALADQRTLWGLDAPQKLDVRASQGPFDTLSDEALAAELTRQQELLAARDDAAPTPAAPNAEEGPDDDR